MPLSGGRKNNWCGLMSRVRDEWKPFTITVYFELCYSCLSHEERDTLTPLCTKFIALGYVAVLRLWMNLQILEITKKISHLGDNHLLKDNQLHQRERFLNQCNVTTEELDIAYLTLWAGRYSMFRYIWKGPAICLHNLGQLLRPSPDGRDVFNV